MSDIQEVLREMRPFARMMGEPVPQWADAIEAAMREPVAYLMEHKESPHLAKSLRFSLPEWHITWTPNPLFTFPPDAAGEIERLHEVIDRAANAWMSLEPQVAWEGDVADAMAAGVAEIERLRALLSEVADTMQVSPLRMELRGRIRAALAGKELT